MTEPTIRIAILSPEARAWVTPEASVVGAPASIRRIDQAPAGDRDVVAGVAGRAAVGDAGADPDRVRGDRRSRRSRTPRCRARRWRRSRSSRRTGSPRRRRRRSPDTFRAAKPVGRISDQFAPAPPLARLKLSSTGVVGPIPEFATTTAVAAEVADAKPLPFVPVSRRPRSSSRRPGRPAGRWSRSGRRRRRSCRRRSRSAATGT